LAAGVPDDRDPSSDTVDVATRSHRLPGLERGTCVGRYVILDQLGQGGMGVVYKAYDPELDRSVALKLLQTEGGAGGGIQRDRLLREAQALARLSHPNVVAVHDVGSVGEQVFIAMEFVDGMTLRRWLKVRARSSPEILAAFLAAGEGLAAAHRAGLVHRDFKPDNVVVGSDDRVRVLDFGLVRAAGAVPRAPSADEPQPVDVDRGPEEDAAVTQAERSKAKSVEPPASAASTPTRSGAPTRERDSSSAQGSRLSLSLTRVGTIMGTPRFMAPEQHLGEAADPAADQFSFCVALYWALYGAFPFGDSTTQEVLDNILQRRIAEPPAGATVPRWLRQVLVRGLAPHAQERFPSMEALLAALRADPRAARARWALYAGGVALCALAVGIGTLRGHRPALCAGAEAKLVGVWDDARKTEMRAAFRQIERPWAAQAYERASRVLDEYARNWVAMHTSACEATRVRGEQSEELLDLRMECLDQRAHELGALADVFISADDRVVQKAVQAAESLTPLAGCANAAALKAPTRLPSDPVARAQVEAVRERIARGLALMNAGKYKEDLAWMKPVVEEARRVNHPPTEAWALRLYGGLQRFAGDATEADATYKQALLAAERGKDDQRAAQACIGLVRSWIDRQSGSPEARFWGDQAAAWVSRLGGSDPALEVHLESALAAIAWGRDDYDEAQRHDQRGLALAEKAFGADSVEFAKTLGDLATDYYEMGQYQQSDEYGERELAIEEKALGPTHPSVGEALSNRALDLIALARLDEAEQTLIRAGAILRPVSLPGNPWLGEIDAAMGKTNELQGRYADALRVLRAALAEQKEQDTIAVLMTGVGSVLNRQRKFSEALSLHQKALAIKERFYGGPHRLMGDSLLGIGLARIGLGQPALAIAPLERADALVHLDRESHGLVRQALAQALASSRSGADARARIRTLLTQARADLTPTAKLHSGELAQIEAWLTHLDASNR
jgi:serine/threonine protein kinase/tetratricopeptide (TPR) repeat protein